MGKVLRKVNKVLDTVFEDEELIQQLLDDKELLTYLKSYVTENKLQVFDKVLQHRTQHLTVILEDIYQSHNASAVLRSCDCFGVQDLHIVEVNHNYTVNKKVVKGSAKWIDRHHYDNTASAYTHLKEKGYKIVATSPHAEMTLENLPLDDKVALVFGTEKEGISDYAGEEADYKIRIPMYGFTESFNISVSAAICLNQITTRLHNSDSIDWQYTAEDRKRLEARWVMKVLNSPDKYVADYYARKKKENEL